MRYGCTNLSLLLREFGGEDTALAAYHAGRGSVNRWLGDSRYSDDGDRLSTIPYRDTDAYVKKVLDTRDRASTEERAVAEKLLSVRMTA